MDNLTSLVMVSTMVVKRLNETHQQNGEMIESMGIQTLSYFIGDGYEGGSEERSFKICMVKVTKMIDVQQNVNQITKTMNGLFLTK